MRPQNPPKADYDYGYLVPPASGNDLNGLGARHRYRPKKMVPDDFTITDYEYKALFDFFFMIMKWKTLKEYVMGMFESRNARGSVSKVKTNVDDPGAMANHIKEKAREFGFSLAGITEVKDELLLYEDDESYPYKYAICLGIEQDRKIMEQVPQPEAGHEVVSAYRRSSKYSNQLAAYIRAMGWPAEAFAIGRDILMIPSAIQAGLGQLGKHGSMISRECGSNFRLTMVLTDMPLDLDEPVDIGVDDFCMSCQACTRFCPPSAISDSKQLVRGEMKWYVDFDKCAWYFSKTTGCSICVEVCPWSTPGKGFKLSELMMSRRNE